MSIRTKILVPLLAFLMLGAMVSGFIGWKGSSSLQSLAALSDNAITASDASRTAREGFDTAEQLVSRVLAMTDLIAPSAIEPRFRAATETTAAALVKLKTAAFTPGMSGIAQSAIENFARWQKDAEVLVGLRKAKEIATLEVMRRSGEDIRDLLNRAVALAGQDARTQIAEQGASLSSDLRLVFLMASGAAIAGVAGAFWLARNLSQPLRDLVRSADQLARGDVTVAIKSLDRGDEVGEIARAVNVFRSNVSAQTSAEAQASQQQRQSVEERQRYDFGQAEAARQQGAIMDAIASALKRLAGGDLTTRLSDFPATYKVLETDYNAAMGQLRDALHEVTRDTHSIHSATKDMSATATDLAGKTEQQTEDLGRTALALDTITKTVRETANSAKHASEVVSNAQTEAEKSGSVVRNAVQAMNELERSSGQISQIIGVIDEIAFQTSLLALNAGVEAARAGDSGRGFAVVASEVRALAQRSADAARQIKQLISASSQQIDSGVGLVKETGTALDRIMAQVGEINTIVMSISTAANEQATGLDGVNAAVAAMGRTTQTNAGLVDRSAAASADLASEADRLAHRIARFTTTQAKAGFDADPRRISSVPRGGKRAEAA